MVPLAAIVGGLPAVDKIIHGNKIEPHTEFFPEKPFGNHAQSQTVNN